MRLQRREFGLHARGGRAWFFIRRRDPSPISFFMPACAIWLERAKHEEPQKRPTTRHSAAFEAKREAAGWPRRHFSHHPAPHARDLVRVFGGLLVDDLDVAREIAHVSSSQMFSSSQISWLKGSEVVPMLGAVAVGCEVEMTECMVGGGAEDERHGPGIRPQFLGPSVQ